jgi:large subunit ribosomal protein L10Ae
MSKLSGDLLRESLAKVLEQAKENKRNFLETVELQVALKNYDLQKDKRFSGSIRLPYVPRPRFKICVLGDQKHIDECKEAKIDALSVDDLKKTNKNKKIVRKLAKKYNAFLASPDLIKKIPRLLGPGLMKAGKFPSVIGVNESVVSKSDETKASVKFQLKKVMCLGVAVGNVNMTPEELIVNITLSVNFLVSLLKKNWQNVKRLYVKSSMGSSHRVFGF